MKTLREIFYSRISGSEAGNIYLHYKRQRGESYRSLSYEEFGARVHAVASSFERLGIAAGERILISSESSPEWLVTDFSAIVTGAITVPVYPTLTAKQVDFILRDSGAIAAVVSTEYQLRKILASSNISLKWIIVTDDAVALPEKSTVECFHFSELEREGILGKVLDHNSKAEDVVTIIYTSGTTGEPKGVMLTNRNLVSNLKAALDAIPPVTESDIFLSFLPLSHSFERIASYLVFYGGAQIAFAESIESLAQNMLEIRPTVMTAVPRFFDRLSTRIESSRNALAFHRKIIFDWGLRVGKEYAKHYERQPVSILTKLQYPLAEKLVLRKIKEKTGGNLRFFVSGGAALPPELGKLFAALSLPIFEGYGLTETSPVVAVNRLNSLTWGTVGPPLYGVEVKIADDGEILIRGELVMAGYYNHPAATAEMIDPDGWLHSGDIGIITDTGLLKITDRKKHLIVLANGKNIAPMGLESKIEQSPMIEQAIVLGEAKDYCTALIVSTENKETIQKEIDKINKEFAAFEKIRRFTIITEPFSIENGMLTPTMKIRRKEVEKRYNAEIAAMYQ